MSEPRTLERAPRFQPLPDAVLDVVSGKALADKNADLRAKDDVGEIRRIYESEVVVPSLGKTEFSIDRRHYYQQWENDYDMTDFQYNHGEQPIGTMQFLHKRDGTFELAHRYVEPEFRGKGAGEDLLARAEAAFQAVANKDSQDIAIKAQFGQRRVINWFLKHGYELADDHSREDWEDVQAHPENYIFATVDDDSEDDKLGREDGIFRAGDDGRTIDDTVRINLQKILSPKSSNA